MTRRDFELIARVLRESRDVLPPALLEVIAERFASALVTANERFDWGRFVRACGVQSCTR